MTDALVVGAGFSGLAAALSLVRAGRRVRVLEARDRVGGRALTRWLDDGTQLDLGAQWIGPGQDRVNALVRRYALGTFPSPAYGGSTVIWDGARRDAAPEPTARVVELLDGYAARLDPAAPWTAPEAVRWDRITLGGWLAATAPDPVTARYLGRLLAGGLLATSADEVSVLQMAFYLRSGGGSGALLRMAGGAQQDRIVGGPAALAEAMAAALGPDVVRLAAPVVAIEQDRAAVVVYTDAERFDAAAVVVAVPPTLAGRIRYAPALPALRDGLTQRMPMGSAFKVHAVYPEPFWRADGRSGVATCSDGPVVETVDNSTPTSSRGVLTAFSYGVEANALRAMTPPARRAALLDALTVIVGPAARHAEEVIEYDWSADPWTRGCFCGALTPGSWRQYGPWLRPAVGRIHWAGTETATRWTGYLDGAIEAGERAAAEVLGRLPTGAP
ncbi:monoamine oxidase [Micromonospora phaseoli]|uniref:Monoamine oxidase n=1 Tax=Micromonospora phaseoli TaxID=1144548 RepID=A0A1H6YES7_9ACTN|nr:FAD-dependent oxidoreductase [Micromonospora phaseoli]PZW00168.1 monoamine oxidase [Micromonospora phaseoli]GIJ78874.1 monoamine oxidase [Micromonospora phaseoli]SEJ39778.1 monoamine oxidase [Micromonospora phaseoli]